MNMQCKFDGGNSTTVFEEEVSSIGVMGQVGVRLVLTSLVTCYWGTEPGEITLEQKKKK